VEARNHSKNGAEPKSLMSREIKILKKMDVTIFIIIGVVVVFLLAVKTSKSEHDTTISADQTNKVVNVALVGGLIGLFVASPQNSLNSRIKTENANGWRVVQVISADSGNIFLYIFRLLLLVITFFLYTTANGYYVIMEKK